MIHFLYLISGAALISAIFGLFSTGNGKAKVFAGLKAFLQFVGISLILGWIFYFIPS